jgi:integrase
LARGTVSKKMRASGMTWIYRFQTTRPSDGARVENTRVIGLVKDIGASDAAAWKEVGRLGLDINLESQLGSKPTFRELAEHFRERELRKESGVGLRASETVTTHELLLDRWILPRWGEKLASEMKSVDIESWFESLTSKPQTKARKPLTWATVSKMKSVMAQVFKHAQRHELIPAAIDKDGRPTNPALLARCEAGSDYEAVVVTPEKMIVILKELDKPETLLEWTLALLHAATAMRPEETFGLKWADIDWKRGQVNIRRGWSKGKETAGKNEGSMTQVAMHPALSQALQAWRRESRYSRDSDWVFASNNTKGKTPRSAGVAGQDYLRPAAVKAGVIPPGYCGRFGWHNLRHSLATFLADQEVSLAIIQKTLRHAKPTTSALYIHRVGAAQVAAQGKYLKAIKLKSKRISVVA